MRYPVLTIALLLTVACATNDGVPAKNDMTSRANLVIRAGTVFAGAALERRDDTSIVVRDGRIVRIAPYNELARGELLYPTIDAQGATVLPGLVDAHAHLDGLGRSLDIVDLRGTTSFDEVVTRVAETARRLPAGTWVLGRGWDQNDWAVTEFPTSAELDAAVPDHPVSLDRIDGHAILANSAAIRAAGVDASTPDPAGGKILRNASGAPSGVFIDNAVDVVRRAIAQPTREVMKDRLRRAAHVVASTGLTAIHQTGVGIGTNDTFVEILQELADSDELPIRVYVMLGDVPEEVDRWLERGPLVDDREKITVRSIKMYADGALGSRGAFLLEQYADDPGNSGLLITVKDRITDLARRARARGFQVSVHAIGDGGVRTVVDAFEDAGIESKDRFRIEHLQVASPADFPRIAARGIIASVQPTHATSDMPWAERRLGGVRVLGAYAWRTLLDGGAHLALGSDFPVEEVNPFLGIYAAITRQDLGGKPSGGWYPDQRLTLIEAIRGFSAGAAYAAYEDDRRGTVDEGKWGDFTIVEGDLEKMSPSDLAKAKVRFTIVNGRVVFQRATYNSSNATSASEN